MINFNKLENYILSNSESESEILKKLYHDTNVQIYHPRMLSGHLQGRILKMLCSMINPKNVLEIGTYTGYSALCIAEALNKNAKIHTIEKNDELEDFIKKHINKSEHKNKIILHFGDALKIIPNINITFDLAFIDGDKKEYVKYYNILFNKIKKGGFIIADNVLWNGKVTEEYNLTDEQTKGIIDFNNVVTNDKRVINVMLPIRDGMMLIKKI